MTLNPLDSSSVMTQKKDIDMIAKHIHMCIYIYEIYVTLQEWLGQVIGKSTSLEGENGAYSLPNFVIWIGNIVQ